MNQDTLFKIHNIYIDCPGNNFTFCCSLGYWQNCQNSVFIRSVKKAPILAWYSTLQFLSGPLLVVKLGFLRTNSQAPSYE
jgi:hypothetical protein